MFTPDKSIVLQYSFIIHIALYIMLHIVTSHKNKIVVLNTGFFLVPSFLITMGPPPIINITGKISIVIIAKRTVCIILNNFIYKGTNNYLINNYSEGFFFNNFFLIKNIVVRGIIQTLPPTLFINWRIGYRICMAVCYTSVPITIPVLLNN